MSDSRKNLVLSFFFCFGAYHNAIGIRINLTRSQRGDYFNNPYATCDKSSNSDAKFCEATDSICYKRYLFQNSKCCFCLCQVARATFDVGKLRCAPNQDFLPDCFLRLKDRVFDEKFLYSIDLTKDGQKQITAANKLPSGAQYQLLSCSVAKVERKNSKSYETVSGLSFGVKSIDKKKDFTMNWRRSDKENYGKVYRIWFKCQYKSPRHTNGKFDDCLMLKSSGTVQIYHPGLPSGGKSSSQLATSTSTTKLTTATTTQPTTAATTTRIITTTAETPTQINPTTPVMTASRRNHLSSSHLHEIILTSTIQELINPSSVFFFCLPTSTRWTRLTPSSIKNEVEEMFTRQTLSATIDRHSKPEEMSKHLSSYIGTEFPNSPKKEERSIANDGKMIVYIVVVVVAVVAIIVLAVLVRYTMVRKKKKASKKRESRVDIIMSDIKNNLNEDEDGYYTSLDKIAGSDESNYEPLTLPATDKNQTIRDACNEKMRQNANESIYEDADRVYSAIDLQTDDLRIRETSEPAFEVNDNERVYSILEEEQGKTGYLTPSTAGNISADPECSVGSGKVNSTIEEIVDASKLDFELNYVTVLPREKDPSLSNCSVYAELSEQRDRNEYQSLVKRKK